MAAHDPAVRLETVAATAGLALFTLRKAVAAGKSTPADITQPGTPNRSAHAWRLSTIRAWNPAVTARCAALEHPLKPAPRTPLKRRL